MDFAPYLSFSGQCEAAFKFYEQVLGGKLLMLVRYGDAPGEEQMPREFANLIMHARLEVTGRLLMGGDAPPDRRQAAQGFCVQIAVDTPTEAERLFNALAAGGSVTMPFGETFWAHRFGMVVDKFGTPWMINCEKPCAEVDQIKPFVISRTFDAPRDAIWKAFTEPERMQKWWGPKGVSIVSPSMDFRPGGIFHYGMSAPDGSVVWGRQVYREIVRQERIVLVNSFSDAQGGLGRHPMAPSWPLEMLSTFTFSEAGSKTTFEVTWLPLNPTAEERQTFDAGHESMRQGWSGTLEQLAAYVATPSAAAN